MKKRRIGLIGAAVLGASLLVGCGDSNNIDYTITKDESKRDIKRTVEVLLPERVDKAELERLAGDIYKGGFERTFIGYRLDGEQEGAYWATTNYNPNLEVRILGSTGGEHEAATSNAIDVDGDLIGTWLVNWGFEYKAAIYEKDERTFITTKFSDGSGKTTELNVQEIDGATRFYDEGGEERGEYYRIGDDGLLQFWSENGNYYTAPIAE